MKLDIRLLALGMALILGVAFEFFKFNPKTHLAKTPRLALTHEVRPYSITTQKLAQPEHARAAQPVQNFNYQSKPIVQSADLPEVEIAAENKEAKKDEAKTEDKKEEKKVTEADEFEDVIDPKTGQLVRRKKVKTEEEKAKQEEEEKLAKQKEDDEAQQKFLKEQVEKEQERLAALHEQERNAHFAGAAGGAQQPQPQQPTSGFSAQGFLSATEWEKKLLNNPSLSATTGFIQAYLGGTVSSTTFYRVVETMLKDNRIEVRGFGLLALGSTPSTISFNELADLSKTESAGSALRPKIDEYLNQYMALQHLEVLSSVINASTSAFNVILAIDKVDASAQKHLSNKTDPNYNRNVAYFKPFISMLEALIKSSDASVVAQAQNTLADLKNLTAST